MTTNQKGLYVYATGPCEGWDTLFDVGQWLAGSAASAVTNPVGRLLDAHLAVIRHPKWSDEAGTPKVAVLPSRGDRGHLFFMWRVAEDDTLLVSPVRLPWLDWAEGDDEEDENIEWAS